MKLTLKELKDIKKLMENQEITQYIYVRFGMPNRDENGNFTRSREFRNGLPGPLEAGISVFEAIEKNGMYYLIIYDHRLRTSLDELIHNTRDAYVVDGEPTNNEGADGEPLLDPKTFKIVKKIDKSKIKEFEDDFPLYFGEPHYNINEPWNFAEYYLDDFYAIDGNEGKSKNDAIKEILKVMDFIVDLEDKKSLYPLKVYRGINTISPKENYDGASWSLDKKVAESFGNKIYVGLIHSPKHIDMEQTIRTRIMNPYENEIYVPNFDDVEIIEVYDKNAPLKEIRKTVRGIIKSLYVEREVGTQKSKITKK